MNETIEEYELVRYANTNTYSIRKVLRDISFNGYRKYRGDPEYLMEGFHSLDIVWNKVKELNMEDKFLKDYKYWSKE